MYKFHSFVGFFICEVCQRRYKYRAGYCQHKKYECGKIPQFKCGKVDCNYSSKIKSNVSRHYKRKHLPNFESRL